MKKRNKYIIVAIIFVITMLCILSFFYKKNEDIDLTNEAKNILQYSYKLKSGEYTYRNNYIYNKNDYIVSDSFLIDGNGEINIDKYNNIQLRIDTNNNCISKTSLGNIEIRNGKCNDFFKFDVEFIKNNNTISFITNTNENEYKISKYDDFKGVWIKNNNNNLVLNSYLEGENYIWFKDKEGNLSDAIKFNVNCFNGKNTNYDSSVFYCSGSSVILDGIKFIVIKDTYDKITLIQNNPLNNKLAHCIEENKEMCNNIFNNYYNWKGSYINQYLNDDYIYDLSYETQNKLIEEEICIDSVSMCDDGKCFGYTKNEIEMNNYICESYTKSKVRLITYNEFNYLYNKFQKNIVGEYHWILNSYVDNKGSLIDSDNNIYIEEELYNFNSVKPVITMSKLD